MRREKYLDSVYKKVRFNGGFLGNNIEYGVGGMWGLYSVFAQPRYAISPRSTSVNEGSTLVFDIATTNVPTGTVLYWTLNRPADFIVSSGSFTINNNAGTVSVTPRADVTTEGAETFTVSIRTVSISGLIKVTSSNITINDTSRTPTGQIAYINDAATNAVATYSWVAPAGVTSVCVVCVGGGGSGSNVDAGGGGGLGWKNNITVVPGTSYTVVVGNKGYRPQGTVAAAGKTSYFISEATVAGRGGGATGNGGTYVGTGGGAGGRGGTSGSGHPGAGGAGGYSGAGGAGGLSFAAGASGSGGGGGGGGSGKLADYSAGGGSGGGGGVGILGAGSSGAGGAGSSTTKGTSGSGGSGGTNGGTNGGAGAHGGGGGCGGTRAATGGSGAVRIIWGANRAFPSTNTGNL